MSMGMTPAWDLAVLPLRLHTEPRARSFPIILPTATVSPQPAPFLPRTPLPGAALSRPPPTWRPLPVTASTKARGGGRQSAPKTRPYVRDIATQGAWCPDSLIKSSHKYLIKTDFVNPLGVRGKKALYYSCKITLGLY